MQTPVYPVYAEICKEDEQWELEEVVPQSRAIGSGIVYLGITANFGQEESGGKCSHSGEATKGLFDFEAHLVLEVFGMLEGCLVKDKVVGEACTDKVNDNAEEPV